MGEIRVAFEADESDAARGTAAFIRLMTEAERSTERLHRTGRSTTRAVKDGMAGAGKETDLLKASIGYVTTAATGMVTALLAMAGPVKIVRELVSQLKEARDLAKSFHEQTIDTEKMVLKIGHLRGDVGPEALKVVEKEVTSLARGASVPRGTAASALFFSESALGGPGPAATASAENILAFGGPAGLSEDATKIMPKFFYAMKAMNKRSQMEALNILHEGTRLSIGETEEVTVPFLESLISDLERGFTLPESLSRMTAAVAVSGSAEEAATLSKRLVDVATGRSEKGLEFLTAEGKRQGVDFTGLTDPERVEFSRGVYQRYKDEGKMDVLKTQMDVKGFDAWRRLFGERGTAAYQEALPQIEAAAGSGAVERMAEQFKRTHIAKQEQKQITKEVVETEAGRQSAPYDRLMSSTEEVVKLVRADANLVARVGLFLLPEKYLVSRAIMKRQLSRIEDEGGERGRQAEELWDQKPLVLTSKKGKEWVSAVDALAGDADGRVGEMVETLKDIRESLKAIEGMGGRGSMYPYKVVPGGANFDQ